MTASTVTESTAVTLCYIAPIPQPSDTICPSAELLVVQQNQSNMSHSQTLHEPADVPVVLLSASSGACCPGVIVGVDGRATGWPGGGPTGGPGGGPTGGPAVDMLLLLLLLSAWLSAVVDMLLRMLSAWPGGGPTGGPGGGPTRGPSGRPPTGGPEAPPGRLLTTTGIIKMRPRYVNHGLWQPPLSNGEHNTGYRSPIGY